MEGAVVIAGCSAVHRHRPRLLQPHPVAQPLIYWLRDRGFTMHGVGGFVVNLVVITAVTGTLAFLTYRFVELPAMNPKRRPARPD